MIYDANASDENLFETQHNTNVCCKINYQNKWGIAVFDQ